MSELIFAGLSFIIGFLIGGTLALTKDQRLSKPDKSVKKTDSKLVFEDKFGDQYIVDAKKKTQVFFDMDTERTRNN